MSSFAAAIKKDHDEIRSAYSVRFNRLPIGAILEMWLISSSLELLLLEGHRQRRAVRQPLQVARCPTRRK